MAISVSSIEIWDDVEANGGSRESVIPDWIEAVETLNLQGKEILEVTLRRESDSWADVEHRKVIQMVLSDASVSEWRIIPIEDEMDQKGGLLAKIQCEAIRYDLGSRIIERVEDDGRAHGVFTLLSMSPEDHVDFLLASAPGWFTKGTIDPTDDVDLQYENDSPLSSLMELAVLTGTELEIERNGSTDFLVHLRTSIASGAEKAYLTYRKNLQGIRRKSEGADIVNRVFPVGATVDGVQATIGDAEWEVTTVFTGGAHYIELAGSPIRFNDQFNGYYVERTDGQKTSISDSIVASQRLLIGSATSINVGDFIKLRRNVGGDDLTFLDDPASIATYNGAVEKVVRRGDIPLITNLVSNPFMADWTAGLPDDWTKVGAPTVAQETSEAFTRFGGSSAHVTAAEGEGLKSAAVTIDPTDRRPFFSSQMGFWLVSGAVKVTLRDLTNTEDYPPVDDDRGRSSKTARWTERLAIEGIDLNEVSSVSVQLEITAIGGAAEFYLDAAQLENTGGSAGTYLDGRAPNLLWHIGNDFLEARSQPKVEFTVSLVDVQRLHPDVFEFDELVLGGPVQVIQGDLDLDFETRIIEIVRDRRNEGVTRVKLSNRPEDLSGKLGTPGRRPREEMEKDLGVGSGVATFEDAVAWINADGDLLFRYRLNQPTGLSIKWKYSDSAAITRGDCISTGTTRNAAEDEFTVAVAAAPTFGDELWLTAVAFSGPSAAGFPGEAFTVHLQVSMSGVQIEDGTITAVKLIVATLSAIVADMGTLTAGKIKVGSIEINAATERILMGLASAPLTGLGVFIGKDGADYEFRVGDPAGDFIHWDGSVFTYPNAIVNPPVIEFATLVVHDDGSDDNYTSAWTLGGSANDTDHLVRVTYFREGVETGEVSGITPSDLSDVFVDTGAGTGVPNLHHAIIELYNVSGGATVNQFITREDVSTI